MKVSQSSTAPQYTLKRICSFLSIDMSWQGPCRPRKGLKSHLTFLCTVYVDSNLVGTGKIAHAAILGQAGGGSVWAKSANIGVSSANPLLVGGLYDSPCRSLLTLMNLIS